MKNDALTKFLELAEDHYWNSFEKDRKIILAHINEIATKARRIVEVDTMKPACMFCGGREFHKDDCRHSHIIR